MSFSVVFKFDFMFSRTFEINIFQNLLWFNLKYVYSIQDLFSVIYIIHYVRSYVLDVGKRIYL